MVITYMLVAAAFAAIALIPFVKEMNDENHD